MATAATTNDKKSPGRPSFGAGLVVGLGVGLAAGVGFGLSLRPAPPSVKELVENRDETGSLTGRITSGGQPIPFLNLMASGPKGYNTGGSTNENGEYTMPEPPKGLLRFQVFIPGKLPKGVTITEKYAKADGSGLTFEYKGGRQTFDIDLK